MVGPIAALESFIFKALDFSGRATRAEFWWAFLALGVAAVISIIMDAYTVMSRDIADLGFTSFLTPWLFLLSFVPYLSLRVRRLHDVRRSGMWLFMDLVPIVGPIMTHVMLAMPSDPEENPWGQPPRHTFAGSKPRSPAQGEFAAEAAAQCQQEKPHNAFQSYAYLVNGEAEPTPDMIEQRRNEIKDYYRARVLGQGA
ncbi:DUF805 domain-containing protein [Pacificoceanicola onchidii]|uniref:DUF805 domain-containing protein n=1 Tax=Pacificoceanicola onchidii TaxID=2562685 RepID=UPI0010A392CD|nr:DUF805 domain-containing protein [Pacificoceanicola onchidii]